MPFEGEFRGRQVEEGPWTSDAGDAPRFESDAMRRAELQALAEVVVELVRRRRPRGVSAHDWEDDGQTLLLRVAESSRLCGCDVVREKDGEVGLSRWAFTAMMRIGCDRHRTARVHRRSLAGLANRPEAATLARVDAQIDGAELLRHARARGLTRLLETAFVAHHRDGVPVRALADQVASRTDAPERAGPATYLTARSWLKRARAALLRSVGGDDVRASIA
jgi:hypothetical protein